VDVTVGNRPTAGNDQVTTAEDTPVAIAVLSNDSDPDGDPVSIASVASPAHGSAVIDTSGTITYTPLPNYNGTDSFTYTASDGGGGTATATVSIIITPVDDNPRILSWASAGMHGRGVGEATLDVPDDGSFSEPRLSGISTLLVRFDSAIAPASLMPAGVQLWGNDVNNQPVNLSGITVAVATRTADTIAVLSFGQPLPDDARYLIRLTGVTAASDGSALAGDNDRILTALLGDTTGDGRVNNTDVGGVQSLRGIDPINPADRFQVASDVTNDGRINNSDVGGILSLRGKDARFIADPVPPALNSGLGVTAPARSELLGQVRVQPRPTVAQPAGTLKAPAATPPTQRPIQPTTASATPKAKSKSGHHPTLVIKVAKAAKPKKPAHALLGDEVNKLLAIQNPGL